MAKSVPRLLLAAVRFALTLTVGFASLQRNAGEVQFVATEDLSLRDSNNTFTFNAPKTRVLRVADDCPVNMSVLAFSNTTDVSLVDFLGMYQASIIDFWYLAASSGRESLQPYLKAWDGQILKQYGRYDAFSYFNDTFSDVGRSGLSISMREFEFSGTTNDTELSEYGAREHKYVVANFRFQRLRRDYAEEMCAERNALPMDWLLKTPSREGSRSKFIQVNAIPVQLLEDGSFRVVHEEGFPRWSLMQQANKEFFMRNRFVHKVETPRTKLAPFGLKTSLREILHYQEVSEELFNCTADYFDYCATKKEAEEAGVCSRWGQKCGIQDLIALDNKELRNVANTTSASHILYVIGRDIGIRNVNSTLDDDDVEGSLKESRRNAISSFLSALKFAASDAAALTNSLQTNRKYVPNPGGSQEFIIFLISVLTWFAEWIVSNPVWALRVWIYIVLRRLDSLGGKHSHQVAREGPIVFSRTFKRCLLIIPAIVGLVPIVAGVLFAYRLEQTHAGVLALGYAVSTYEGLLDMNTESDVANEGVSLEMILMYTRNRGFENLKTEYLVALCIASVLLVFSCIPVLYVVSAKYLRSRRHRPGFNLTDKIEGTGEGRVTGDRSQFVW